MRLLQLRIRFKKFLPEVMLGLIKDLIKSTILPQRGKKLCFKIAEFQSHVEHLVELILKEFKKQVRFSLTVIPLLELDAKLHEEIP